MSELVIRAMSLAAPFGRLRDIDAFLASDKSFLTAARANDGTPITEGRCTWAEESIIGATNGKLRKQVDRSTLLAMSCLQELAQAHSASSLHRLDDVGLFIASQFGGMDFSEIQLANLVANGPRRVSAYQAIAWFYAATQGQWTIARGSHGFAKSIAGDLGGFVQTLTAAYAGLRAERFHAAFCGAVDCCLTPYARRILAEGGHTPEQLGEGGAFFWLERSTRSTGRTSRIAHEVRISRWGSIHLPSAPSSATAAEVSELLDCVWPPCLWSTSRLLIVLDGAEDAEFAAVEKLLVEELHSRVDVVGTVCPKKRFGHLLSGAMPVDVAIAAQTLSNASRESWADELSNRPADPNCAVVLSLSPYRLLNYVLLHRT
ncbi:MAG TPA: hypothetical protein VFP68_19405 [Burkholderiaceae bacterium]|nr:hypothetical protein [Burkholderiaceae bacterium]